MNKRQMVITAIGVSVIVAICIYCLTAYQQIDKRYPRGTYKFQTTAKTLRIRELYFTLGVYTIIAGLSTAALIYLTRTKGEARNGDFTFGSAAESIKDEIEDFVKERHTSDDIELQMRHLGELKSKGLITENEYNRMVDEIFEKV